MGQRTPNRGERVAEGGESINAAPSSQYSKALSDQLRDSRTPNMGKFESEIVTRIVTPNYNPQKRF